MLLSMIEGAHETRGGEGGESWKLGNTGSLWDSAPQLTITPWTKAAVCGWNCTVRSYLGIVLLVESDSIFEWEATGSRRCGGGEKFMYGPPYKL